MNVTPLQRSVTDYQFTLSAQDLERYLADPQAWADDVRAQLNGAAPISGGGSMKPSPKDGGGRAPSSRRSSKKSSRKLSPKSSKPTLSCPVCRNPFKSQKRLSNHLEKAHPDYEPKETYSP